MRIDFDRSGGFAGIRLSATLDTDALAAQQAAQLQNLIDDADFFGLPGRLMPETAMPDAFEYHVQISSAHRTHAIVAAEGSIPDGLRPLLDYLTSLSILYKQKPGQ